MSALLMSVGRSAPRYQRMALLYSRSRTLQSLLLEYFIVVVRLCHHLLRASKKSLIKHMMSFTADSELTNYQVELESWANSIKEEVTFLMSQDLNEQSSRFKSLPVFSVAEMHRRRLKAKIRVLESCSVYDYQTSWKEIRKKGSATLFHSAQEYQQWRQKAHSASLVYTGKLGAGKSVLMANIVDDLHLHAHSAKAADKVPVAYFFCRYDDTESLKAQTIFGSLVRQLLQNIPDLTHAEQLIDQGASVSDTDLVLQILECALPADSKAYIVLDGLDECDAAEARIILQLLQGLQASFSILLCLSYKLRGDNSLAASVDELADQNRIGIPDNNPDISSFISSELEKRILSGKLAVGDPTLILEIQNTLVQGAQGMFLWVALQIESLCSARTDGAIWQALKNLPKDLPGTFHRIIQKEGVDRKRLQLQIFEFITAAHRPLTAQELREALSVTPGNINWDSDQLLNDIYSALTCCGSLVNVDEEESTVRLIHHSVQQFLLGEFHDSAPAMLSIQSANIAMASTITTYINYNVFNTQLSTTVIAPLPIQKVPERIVGSLDSSLSSRIALKLLRSRNKPDFDISTVIAKEYRHFGPPPADQFVFYRYAKTYCLGHASYLTDLDLTSRSLLRRAVHSGLIHIDVQEKETQQLVFQAIEFGNVTVLELFLDMGGSLETRAWSLGQTLLLFAVDRGQEAVIQLLLKRGADTKSRPPDSLTPLTLAVTRGHQSIIQLLVDHGADVNEVESSLRTPIFYAVRGGNQEVTTQLLFLGAELETRDGNGHTTLATAVSHAHIEIVRILLDLGADVNTRNDWLQTPLMRAAECGLVEIVRLLLSRGADVNSMDQDGHSALSRAASNNSRFVISEQVMNFFDEYSGDLSSKPSEPQFGATEANQVSVLGLLLDKGANVDCSNAHNQTPLYLAAKAGNKAAARLLIKRGATIEWKAADDTTPLYAAAKNGHQGLVDILLQAGASLELSAVLAASEAFGQTLLSQAHWSGFGALVGPPGQRTRRAQQLLDVGADVNWRDLTDRTLLSWAAQNGFLDMTKLLVNNGADPGLSDHDGRTAVWWAQQSDQIDVVEFLFSCGASLDANAPDVVSAISWAAKNGQVSTLKLLLDLGYPVDKKFEYEEDAHTIILFTKDHTLLSWAARYGKTAVIKLLLERRANLDADGRADQTAAWWATQKGYDAVAALLSRHNTLEKGLRNSQDLDTILNSRPAP